MSVLFAYDGSELAREAIAQSGRRLRPGPALVLTVAQPVESIAFGPMPALGAAARQVDDGLFKEATELAAEGARLAREAGFDASPLAERGSGPAWATIVTVAEDCKAQLIVLGSHGRSGLDYMINGSVATAVSQHSKRSVLIAHPEASDG